MRPPPRPVRGFLLDLDGTLTDTEPVHHATTNDVLASFGARPLSDAEYAPYVGWAEQAFWEDLIRVRQIPASWPTLALARTEAFLRHTRTQGVPLRPFAREFLKHLADRNIPAAVASAAPAAQIQQVLEVTGLGSYLKGFRSAHDHVPHSKPAPDVYLAAADLLGLSPTECVAVEDSLPGVQSARSSGAWTAWVPSGEGANPHACDRLFSTLQELWTFVSTLP